MGPSHGPNSCASSFTVPRLLAYDADRDCHLPRCEPSGPTWPWERRRWRGNHRKGDKHLHFKPVSSPRALGVSKKEDDRLKHWWCQVCQIEGVNPNPEWRLIATCFMINVEDFSTTNRVMGARPVTVSPSPMNKNSSKTKIHLAHFNPPSCNTLEKLSDRFLWPNVDEKIQAREICDRNQWLVNFQHLRSKTPSLVCRCSPGWCPPILPYQVELHWPGLSKTKGEEARCRVPYPTWRKQLCAFLGLGANWRRF